MIFVFYRGNGTDITEIILPKSLSASPPLSPNPKLSFPVFPFSMGQQDSGSCLTEEEDTKFSDSLEEFPLLEASNSIEFEYLVPQSNSSSVSEIDDNYWDSISNLSKHTPESQSFPSYTGVRRRRHIPRQSSKEHPLSPFKNSADGLVDLDVHESIISPGKKHKLLWNLKDTEKLNGKLNLTKVRANSDSVGKRFADATSVNSSNSSVITTVTADENVSDESVMVDSPNSGSNLLFTLAGLTLRAISFQVTLLVGFVTFPIWLLHSSYLFLIDPFAIVKTAKGKKSTWKLCLQIGWGLLWSAFIGFILIGLVVFSLVISGTIMKFITEVPFHKVEQLNFDYTQDTPMAFVPIMSSQQPFCSGCDENIKFGDVAQSRIIPHDHKLQATVSLTLPESYYNRNLGIFQVRVDFLSESGKFLATTTQLCMLHFKSPPIRLLTTFLKLAPLITGYSSESQTVEIKFREYTERKIPTSGVRVVLEPRAQFAKGGVLWCLQRCLFSLSCVAHRCFFHAYGRQVRGWCRCRRLIMLPAGVQSSCLDPYHYFLKHDNEEDGEETTVDKTQKG
ncbi:unnamed protein product [Lactuca virosa]|uniref:Seipin n=1 Tax=Lactuca virosa TaxID=75947 RepID=A0AAU9NR50_9ASTR|nr:unnamed protein product [Lactuca virosa]